LLLIHGVPEITKRLRAKVENYAIYSALFLSATMVLLTDPPDSMVLDDNTNYGGGLTELWYGYIRKRVALYSFVVGVAAHMLSILLGMEFLDALNEAARDSDVFRMFARGQGFRATVKCKHAFRVGVFMDLIAMSSTITAYVEWFEVLLIGIPTVVVCIVIYKRTSSRLLRHTGIIDYWRRSDNKEDPYDLRIPCECFKAKAKMNWDMFLDNVHPSFKPRSATVTRSRVYGSAAPDINAFGHFGRGSS